MQQGKRRYHVIMFKAFKVAIYPLYPKPWSRNVPDFNFMMNAPLLAS